MRQAREELYGQMRQLELDRDAGLVDEAAFRGHMRELRIEAARLLRAERQMPEELSPEEELEREIAAARQRAADQSGREE